MDWDSHDGTAALAFRRWQERGCPGGSDQEDWFQAERELSGLRAAPAGTRRVAVEMTAYTKSLELRKIPANAILHGFRAGPGHEGPAPYDPCVASFYYNGELHFNILEEVVGRTVLVSAGLADAPHIIQTAKTES